MKAARPASRSAEPILLTEATLEHVLDVFLPEDPNAIATAVRDSGPDPTDDLFASEREAPAVDAAPMARSTTSVRTIDPAAFATEDVTLVEPPASPASPVPSRFPTWAIAASVALAVVTAGAFAVQRLGDRANAPRIAASRELMPTIQTPRASPDPVAAAETPTAAPPLAARAVAIPDARVAATALPPVTGAVLKGSLSPDPVSSDVAEPATPPLLDAVRASLPIETPRPTAAFAPAMSSPVEPLPEPAVATPAPPPPSPLPTREVAPVVRNEAPAPASVPASAAAAIPVVSDTASIENVLGRYRTAFKALDATAARAVWPGVDARALSRAFDQLVEQQLDFQNCDIIVASARATAACGGRARYIPKVGTRSMRDEPRQWTFSLQKVNDQWQIDKVVSR